MKEQLIMDIELFHGYFLVAFMRVKDEKIRTFELNSKTSLDVTRIQEILVTHEIITFNGNKYDMPILYHALNGGTNSSLKKMNDDIIGGIINTYELDKPECSHIDLIELAPGKASLKTYGARIHSRKLQDLPIDPSKVLTVEEQKLIKDYCGNDLTVTKMLLDKLTPQINLRRQMSNQYKTDLRSKSDAQIAEAVIKSELAKISKSSLTKPSNPSMQFLYKVPDFIESTNSQVLKAIKLVTTEPFTVSDGKIEMPKELITLQVKINKTTYQLGMGGLHSTEKSCNHKEGNGYILCDYDVASYYPSIILNCGLYPKQMGESFLTVYKKIVEERLIAKKTGNKIKADVLKIVVNGSFGKLGSKYSSLYAPELMIQVTVTGQLSLLMLISNLELAGILVVSANTDGIVIKCPVSKEKKMESIIADWELTTHFDMERSDYLALYSRDVNNYVAIKYNGEVKTKGCFSNGGLNKNPDLDICNEAAIAFLKDGTEVDKTIASCKDITKFLTVRQVNGGAMKDGKFIGKTCRWYYSTKSKTPIVYKTNGNQVAKSFCSRPVIDLPDKFPIDIDYRHYINEAKELLNSVGINAIGQQCFEFSA